MYSGRPDDGASALPGAILRAEKIGHHLAIFGLSRYTHSVASAARGDLVAASSETLEAWEFGVAHELDGISSRDSRRVTLLFGGEISRKPRAGMPAG